MADWSPRHRRSRAQALTEGGSVTGTVLDAATFQPIGCAQVTLLGVDALASQAGQFRFDSVPAGQANIAAVADGYAATSQMVTAADGDTVDVTLMLTATGVGAINGTVREAGTFAAIPGAVVQLDMARTVTADGQGHFQFATVAVGTHTLSAAAPGYTPAQVIAHVRIGRPFVGTILLEFVSATTVQGGAAGGVPLFLLAVAGVAGFLLVREFEGGQRPRAHWEGAPRGVIPAWTAVQRGRQWVIEDDRGKLVSGPYRTHRAARQAMADLSPLQRRAS